jgi:hypothetical protein
VQLAVLTKAQTFVGFRNKDIEFCMIFSFKAEIKMYASFYGNDIQSDVL